MPRKGISTLTGLNNGGGGGGGVPPANPPVPPVVPPATQQTIFMSLAANPFTVFAPGVSIIGGGPITRTVQLPLVTTTFLALAPGVQNMTGAFIEPFTGATGSAPDSSRWATSDKATGSTLHIDNNQLLMAGGAIGSNLDYQYLPSDWTVSNFTMRVDLTLPTGVASPHYVHVGFRGSGVQQTTSGLKAVQTTGYLAEIGVGEHYVKLVELSPGSSSSLSQINLPAFTNGDLVRLQVVGNGTNLRIWCWRNSETMPTTPQINVNDASYTSGKVMLGHTGGADAISDVVRFDNMTIDTAIVTEPPPVIPPTGIKAHWGYSITNYNLGGGGVNFPNARGATAQAVIKSIPNNIVNMHVGGFGVYPPEYINGVFDWSGDARGVSQNGLDDGIALTRAMVHPTTGIKMITLCSAPGWMKPSGLDFGPDPGAGLEEAVLDSMEGEWAQSCAAIAARYTDVRYFNFWNELKGMFISPPTNRWNYEKYTRMYNLAWNAVKAVRPDAKMGGPYPVLSAGDSSMSHPSAVTFPGGRFDQRDLDVMMYFKNNAIGYDYIAVDAWVGNQRGGPSIGVGVTPQQQLGKFIAANNWIRANIHPTKLIVWAEFYPVVGALQTEAVAGDYVIEVLNRTNAECALGEGIWYLQWADTNEPPRPFDYNTGNELPYITPKLRTYEAGTAPPPAGGGGATWNVPAQGSLQQVADQADPGDTIYVTGLVTAGGKQLHLNNRNNGGNPITVIGNPGSILRGYGGIEGYGSNRDWHFLNLTVEVDPANYYGEAFYFAGQRTDQGGDGLGASNIRVVGCTMRPIGGSTNRIQRHGAALWGGTGFEVGDCDIQGCGYNDNGFPGGAASGISIGQSMAVTGAVLPGGHSAWVHGNHIRDVTGPGTGSYDRNGIIMDIWHGWLDSPNRFWPNRAAGSVLIEYNDIANCEGRGIQLLCCGAGDSLTTVRNNLVRAPIATNLIDSEPICGIGGYGVGICGNIVCSNNDVTVSPGAAAYKFVSFNQYGGVTGTGNIGTPKVFDGSPGSTPPVGF